MRMIFFRKPLTCFSLVAQTALIFYMGFFIDRSDFLSVLLCYGLLFACFLIVILSYREKEKFFCFFSVFLRALLMTSLPALSDDYFRFIWDGRLVVGGENPFLHRPSYFMNADMFPPGLNEGLYRNLNSPDYYSVYPPVSQFLFAISCFIFPGSIQGSVIAMRVFIIAAEAGNIFLIRTLLRRFHMPVSNVLFYAMNPLVIIEFTGNIHFEAVMIFFVLLAVYYLSSGRIYFSSAAMGLAVATKLLPAMLPLLLVKRLSRRTLVLFATIVGATFLALLIPFYGEISASNYFESLNFYFQKFEFNAGLFYLVRWLGYKTAGYNVIHTAGPLLAFLGFLVMVIITIREKQISWRGFLERSLFMFSIYLFCATTVHPWYIAALAAFTVFTRYRYAIVWSFAVVFSYSAYQTDEYNEHAGWIIMEYLLVFGCLLYELCASNKKEQRNKI